MTMALHIYRPRQFQWTRFGVSQPCSCGVSVLARFQEPLTRPWACPLCPHGQIVRLFQRTWIRSEWAQWLLSSSIRKIPEALITDSRSLYYVLGHGHVAPMGKWPWHYSSRGWDNPNELDLEWISHVVAELWPAGRLAGDHSIVPLLSFMENFVAIPSKGLESFCAFLVQTNKLWSQTKSTIWLI